MNNDGCSLFVTNLDDLEEVFQSEISGVSAGDSKGVTKKSISKIWSVSDGEAQDVIKSNNHLNRQSHYGLLYFHFSTNYRKLRYILLQSYFFTDIMFVTKQEKSTRGYSMLQLILSDKDFVEVYPMKKDQIS